MGDALAEQLLEQAGHEKLWLELQCSMLGDYPQCSPKWDRAWSSLMGQEIVMLAVVLILAYKECSPEIIHSFKYIWPYVRSF